MIRFNNKGSFKNVELYLKNSIAASQPRNVDEIMQDCIRELKNATPVDTGKTAESWNYTIEKKKNSFTITINNTNIQNGLNVALLLEYGHGTPEGIYISGQEYIEEPVYKAYMEILNRTIKELKRL